MVIHENAITYCPRVKYTHLGVTFDKSLFWKTWKSKTLKIIRRIKPLFITRKTRLKTKVNLYKTSTYSM